MRRRILLLFVQPKRRPTEQQSRQRSLYFSALLSKPLDDEVAGRLEVGVQDADGDEGAVADMGVKSQAEPVEIGFVDLSCTTLFRKDRGHLCERQSSDGIIRTGFAKQLIDLR
jgi:hypothetical protein